MVLRVKLKKHMLLLVKWWDMWSLLVASGYLRMEEKKVEWKKWSAYNFHHYVMCTKISLPIEAERTF